MRAWEVLEKFNNKPPDTLPSDSNNPLTNALVCDLGKCKKRGAIYFSLLEL